MAAVAIDWPTGSRYAEDTRHRYRVFEPLDNGILRCADPETMQRLADGLTAERVDALLRKWLARLPHPSGLRQR